MFFFFLSSFTLASQPNSDTIGYSVGWQQPNSHLLEISIESTSQDSDFLDFTLPNWRPGRYLIQNYARNVQEFSATDDKAQTLKWEKIDKSTWRVYTNKATTIKVFYKYYANILDAGSSLLDDSETYFNGTNLFMYIPSKRSTPCSLRINSPENYSIATALKRDKGNLFLASNYDELADSPVIASPSLISHEFSFSNTTYHIVFQGKLDYDINIIAEQLKKIVQQQVSLFGGTAPFDNYWFLYHISPNTTWHGVEHSFSTSITMPSNAFSSETSRQHFYSISSHELFHAWNVKRISPTVLLNPDYSREAYTRLLWFFEGVTSYYGDLLLKRAGVIDERTYLAGIEKNISDLQLSPGRLIASVEDSSFNDWLLPDDRDNTRISFYLKGEILGLLLDLEIRRLSDDSKSLDDVMRFLYNNYALKNLGVPENGILSAVETVSDSSFQKFFSSFVSGCEELPYDLILSSAGLSLSSLSDKSKPESSLGIKLSPNDPSVILNVVPNSPAMVAGLSKGDVLLAINNTQVSASSLSSLLSSFAPNTNISITVFRSKQLRSFQISLSDSPSSFLLKSLPNKSPSQLRIFSSWLSSLK